MHTGVHLVGLGPLGMDHSAQGVPGMAWLTAVGLVTGLPQAFGPFHFAIAVTRRRFTAVAAVLGQTGL